MSNLVIVAIPDENDRVWKVSSEKKPHLTLLFLGDVDEVSHADQIAQFVEHAANTTLRRFYLPVDRRGELGDDKADVLFFKKGRYDYKAIRDFRVQLLKDNNIRTAYDSTPQFEGPWQPHLTLGYPATPAKPDDKDGDYGFYDVCFNKIAVWFGDYEGPEFLLTDPWEEWETMETAPLDVAMSDESDSLVSDFFSEEFGIEHHGVKGQRWGVRKQETAKGGHIRISNKTNAATVSGRNIAAIVGLAAFTPLLPAIFLSPRYRAEANAAATQNRKVQGDKKFKKAIAKSKKAAKVHNTAAREVNSKLPDFNNDKRWKDASGKDIDFAANSPKQKEYDLALQKEILNPAYSNAAIKVYGSESPSGRYKFEIHDAETATLKFRDTLKEAHDSQVEHAADDDEEITVEFKISRNAQGRIRGFVPVEDDMEHSAAEDGAEFMVFHGLMEPDEFLAHYGKKGMRWGVRNEDISNAAKSGKGAVAKAVRETEKFVKDVNFESRTAKQIDKDTGEEKPYSTADRMVLEATHKEYHKDLKAINAKPEYVKASKLHNRLLKPFDATTKAYRKEAKEAYINRLETEANKMKNASNTREYTIRERGGDLPKSKYQWEVSTREARHADGVDFILVDVLTDEDGFITGTKTVSDEDSMAQSMAMGAEFIISLGISDADLEHYGVKGMQWGVRRNRETPLAVNASARSRVPHGNKRKTKIEVEGGENHPAHEDAIKVAEAKAKLKKSGVTALSNNELQTMARRLQLENQVAMLNSNQAQKFIQRQLQQQGQQAIQRNLSVATGKKVVKKAGKGAATVAVTAALL